MPITGTYSGGSASANSYNTIGELLSQLPDNTSSSIVAQDIRDSVYSLWTRIDDVQILASQSASASSYYTNPATVPVTIGGISAGMSFSGTYSMQQMFDMLLYPYIPLTTSISGGTTLEFGNTNLLVTLNWSVTKNSNNITLIKLNGVNLPVSGNSTSSVAGAFAIQNTTTTFGITASDGTTTVSSFTQVNWTNARYWGVTSSFGPVNSGTIRGLTGAGVGSGKELLSSRVQTRNGIDGGGRYLVFAWPTSGTPTFIINGLPNTAWTKVNSNYTFTNVWGYTASYDVWMSNTPQFSPITSFQIN